MIIRLAEATPENSGAKAAVLGRLLRAGFPVPPGFVIPIDAYRTATAHLDLPKALASHDPDQALPAGLLDELRGALEELGNEPLAVRSSATGEDTTSASAAGQYDSYLGIRGVPAVADKVQAIWSSLWSRRAVAYRQAFGQEPGQPDEIARGIAVIVQQQVQADVAGVLFTADRRTPDNSTPTDTAGTTGAAGVLEASWGLGESVVQGLVNPDSYSLSASGRFSRRLGTKSGRRDAGPAGGVVVSEVPLEERERFCLDERLVRRVTELGRAVAAELDGPQDIEFAVEGDHVWLLQARPITAPLAAVELVEEEAGVLRGVGGSPGVATGPARVVEGVGDFGRVEKGDVLVCRFTDPAWTPLFGVVAGVVTEVGGQLSHAAIVAREHRIPAVLGVAGVMAAVEDGQVITIVGNTGMVSAPGLLGT